MEKIIKNSHNDLNFRHPVLNDGYAIYQLIKSCPPLDLNSSYLYFLQASHFSESCIVVEQDAVIVGFISAYYRPDQPQCLFVWQVAVAKNARGRGLAKAMLLALLKSQSTESTITEISCTISPSNKASQGFFSSFGTSHGLILEISPFINETHFGQADHEAEDLYTLKATDHTNLIPYFS